MEIAVYVVYRDEVERESKPCYCVGKGRDNGGEFVIVNKEFLERNSGKLKIREERVVRILRVVN